MFKLTFAIVAALSAAAPCAALADETSKSFAYQGVDYVYTTSTQGKTTFVRGTANHGSEPFELRVTKNSVSGTFDGMPVEFSPNDLQPIGAVLLSSR